MTVVRGLLLLVVLCLLVGCGTGAGGSESTRESGTAADCEVPVRYDGRIYSAVASGIKAPGSTTWPELPGVVEVSQCDDTGRDAKGAYFPDDPRTYQAIELPGVEPERAIGYRVELRNRTVVVLATAQTLEPEERDELREEFL